MLCLRRWVSILWIIVVARDAFAAARCLCALCNILATSMAACGVTTLFRERREDKSNVFAVPFCYERKRAATRSHDFRRASLERASSI